MERRIVKPCKAPGCSWLTDREDWFCGNAHHPENQTRRTAAEEIANEISQQEAFNRFTNEQMRNRYGL